MGMKLQSLNSGPVKSNLDNLYLSQCKICQCGIYKGQPYSWVNRPGVLGLVHNECLGGVR